MVEVKPYDEAEARKTNNIEVYTYRKPTDPTVTLAMVTACAQTAPDEATWVKVVDKEPMTEQRAISIAKEYAEKTGIEVIYVRREEN